MAKSSLQTTLTQLLGRKDEQDRPWFTPEQVGHAVVFILMAGASPGLQLPSAAEEYLGRLGAQLGLRPGADGTRVATVMAEYFASHPLHPALRLELNTLAAESPQGWADLARGVAAALAGKNPPMWLPTMEARQPNVAAGPLARSALKKAAPTGRKKT